MLHNAGNKNILAVGDNVNLKLRAHHIFVDKNGIFNLLRKNDIHVTLNIGVVICDSHVLTADNVGRTEKNGIFKLVCRSDSVLGVHNRLTLRSADAEFFKQFVKALSVLGDINTLSRRAENRNIIFIEELCDLDCRLTAERNNNSYGLFNLDDVHYVLVVERFEIKPVRRVEVG